MSLFSPKKIPHTIVDPNTCREYLPATEDQLAKLAGDPKEKIAPVVEIQKKGWARDLQNFAKMGLLQIKESRGYQSLSRERQA